MFQLHDNAKRADWIGRVRDNEYEHEFKLDARHSSSELHDQQLHSFEKRNVDRNLNQRIVRCDRPFPFYRLQLHGGGNGH